LPSPMLSPPPPGAGSAFPPNYTRIILLPRVRTRTYIFPTFFIVLWKLSFTLAHPRFGCIFFRRFFPLESFAWFSMAAVFSNDYFGFPLSVRCALFAGPFQSRAFPPPSLPRPIPFHFPCTSPTLTPLFPPPLLFFQKVFFRNLSLFPIPVGPP